jgi:hypothetical protein
MSTNAYPQPVGRPYVREARGEGAEFFTGLARQYRARGFVYAPAKFAQGGKDVSRRDPSVTPTRSSEERFVKLLSKNGAEGRNRTADTVIFSHVLYQLSYLGTGRKSLVQEGPWSITCVPWSPAVVRD